MDGLFETFKPVAQTAGVFRDFAALLLLLILLVFCAESVARRLRGDEDAPE